MNSEVYSQLKNARQKLLRLLVPELRARFPGKIYELSFPPAVAIDFTDSSLTVNLEGFSIDKDIDESLADQNDLKRIRLLKDLFLEELMSALPDETDLDGFKVRYRNPSFRRKHSTSDDALKQAQAQFTLEYCDRLNGRIGPTSIDYTNGLLLVEINLIDALSDERFATLGLPSAIGDIWVQVHCIESLLML